MAGAKRRTKPTDLPGHVLEDIMSIPNYDPFRDAGDCYFDVELAEMAVEFFAEFLTHIEGELAGQPFVLEQWQRGIVLNLFGWRNPDGTRRYRELFVYVPRKNGKSTLIAGLMILLLCMDNEYGGQLYAAAGDEDQARVLFDMGKEMVRNEPRLEDRLDVMAREIVRPETNSRYRVIDSKPGTKHGLNAMAAAVDELHVHPDGELFHVLETSTGARRQPLMIGITTADVDQPSFCNDKLREAEEVVSGTNPDRALLPVIYQASPTDDPMSPETWAKANPNLGVSIKREYLERQAQKASRSPAMMAVFKRLHLNVRTSFSNSWMVLEDWDRCGGHVDPDELVGTAACGGLDLGTSGDVSAFVEAFPLGDDVIALVCKFWVPSYRIEVEPETRGVDWLRWVTEGWVEVHDGRTTDHRKITEYIAERRVHHSLTTVVLDRAFQAHQVACDLVEAGIDVTAMGQGFFSMGVPTREFSDRVLSRKLRHGGNPVLRWMIGGTKVDQDPAGNLKPNKRNSSVKIDGVVAAIMAITPLVLGGGGDEWTVYDDRDPYTLT